MRTQTSCGFLRSSPPGALLSASTVFATLLLLTSSSGGQDTSLRQAPLGIEITSPGDS
jgi:hypothetical protein